MGKTGLAQQTDIGRIMFMIDSEEIIGSIAGLGFLLSTFLSAVKMDLRLTVKTGKKEIYFGILSIAVPILFGVPTMLRLSNQWRLDSRSQLALFYATLSYSITPFSSIWSANSDPKILNSELGRLAISSASVSDILAIFLALCCFFTGNTYTNNINHSIRSIILTIAYVIMVLSVVRPAMTWVIKQSPQGRPVKNFYI